MIGEIGVAVAVAVAVVAEATVTEAVVAEAALAAAVVVAETTGLVVTARVSRELKEIASRAEKTAKVNHAPSAVVATSPETLTVSNGVGDVAEDRSQPMMQKAKRQPKPE